MLQNAGPKRGFATKEYETRVGSAQDQMSHLGLDAMLLTTEAEFFYFTGFLTPFWLSPTRPWFLLIPAAGSPVAVIPSIGRSLMAETWIVDIRTWPAPQPIDDGVSLLTRTMAEVVGSNGSVGVPMGHGTHLRMPLGDYANLKARLPGVSFEDATQVIMSLRMVKSEAETAKIAHICSIVSDVFEAISDIVAPAMTEREAFKALRIAILEAGADEVPYLVGATGPGFDSIIDQPSDRVIERGDLLMFDTGSVFDGYWSDFDRYFAFGKASVAAMDAYELVWQATEAGLAAVRPGVKTSELWATMSEVMGSEGSDVGRLGHGLGTQLTEWPSITPNDDMILREGMVLTLEPGMSWSRGSVMVHEENLVVRADGPQILSRRAPRELPIL